MLEDLLLRFRRVWAPPGPVSGQAGVPEEAGTQHEDELRELTAALEAIDQEGQRMIRAANAEAAEIMQNARSEAERVVATARARAPEVRANNAAARIRNRQREIDELIAASEREADTIRTRASARLQPIVDRVAAGIFAGIGSLEEQHARVMGGS